MSFQSTIIADAEELLETFGEQVRYWPAGGSARSILAVVDRNPPAPDQQIAEAGTMIDLTIAVANRRTSIAADDVGGIASDEINTGGDQVELPVRIGQAAAKRLLVRIISQDEAMITLGVR